MDKEKLGKNLIEVAGNVLDKDGLLQVRGLVGEGLLSDAKEKVVRGIARSRKGGWIAEERLGEYEEQIGVAPEEESAEPLWKD